MELIDIRPRHLPEVMSWFPDQQSCSVWGGPLQRFPFTPETFREDAKLDEFPSFCLVDNDDILAFGQYYERAERCHLSRLATSPHHRRRGHGVVLVRELCRIGCVDLDTEECSLFVLENNIPALRLYERLGFVPAPFPPNSPTDLEDCFYMTAPLAAVLRDRID